MPNTRGVESTRTVEMLRRERLATRVWAAAEDGVDMENIEVVDAVEEDEVSTKDYALLLLLHPLSCFFSSLSPLWTPG